MVNVSYTYYFKVLGLLFLLLATLIIILFFIKKISQKVQGVKREGIIKIIGNVVIGPKKSLMLVQFLDNLLLIGVTEKNITLIKEVKKDHGQEFEKLVQEKISDNNHNINSSNSNN